MENAETLRSVGCRAQANSMNQLGRACQIWPIYERVCGVSLAGGGWRAGRGGSGEFSGFSRGYLKTLYVGV